MIENFNTNSIDNFKEKKMVGTSDNQEIFRVVINLEDQYSIWPIRKQIPYGWNEVGKIGTKEECLSHIKEVWTDMKPRSLKEATMKTISELPE